MHLRQYEAMLPGGQSLRRLVDWVRQYIGLELAWDVQLVLLKDEVPRVALGRAGRLGWTTWIRSGEQPPPRDADDLILDPHVN
jgi:type VI secretion system protein ImpH